jgi:hypothetical protein
VRRRTAATLSFALAGCLNFRKVDDAKAPGDMLGTFQVAGTLADSTCGEGALGAGKTWDFEVKLTRFDSDLYWLNGRETIVGDIANDGRSFSIESGVDVKVSDPQRGQKGCIVARKDDAEGKLSDSGTDVDSFDGTLEFTYSQASGSDCSPWLGAEGFVETLPCSITYDLKGVRGTSTAK